MRVSLSAVAALGLFTVASAAWAAPQTKGKVCNVRQFGAKGDGQTNDGPAIQKAIDACAGAPGGGTVLLSGDNAVFLSSPIVLKSNETLRIDKGITLRGSPDHSLYPAKKEFRAPGYQSLVGAVNAENVTITGGGTIDGNGSSWWAEARHEKNAGVLGSENSRPRLIVFDHCKHVRIEGVTVENSPMWQIVPYYTDGVVIRDVTILADPHSPNTDAIDPFSSSNILIERVTADVGDDDIAIKSGMINSPGPDAPTKDVVIRDCHFLHGHGLSIGSELAGGAQNVLAERVTFEGTANGLRIKANRDRGHDVSNIVFKDMTMKDVKTPILVSEYYPAVFPKGDVKPAPIGRLTPFFHNITMENVKATGAKMAGVIVGLPESPVKNITLKNVDISAQTGLRVAYADAVFENVHVTAASGEGIMIAPTAKVSQK